MVDERALRVSGKKKKKLQFLLQLQAGMSRKKSPDISTTKKSRDIPKFFEDIITNFFFGILYAEAILHKILGIVYATYTYPA